MSISLRDEALTIISHLAEIGSRRASSPQEATAAAFINGRLRRAGMGVTTHALAVSPRRRRLYAAVAAAGIIAALTAIFLPLPALTLALAATIILSLDAARGPLAQIGPRHASQSIVGTQAITGGAGLAPRSPRWRVVILAPLDSPTVATGLSILAGPARPAALARSFSLALVVLVALAELLSPHRGWVLFVVPAAILLTLQLAAALRGPQPAACDGNLGALATLVLAAQRLRTLDHVEIWAAAVGAISLDPGGIDELLRIYPFEPARTLIITLEQFNGEHLYYRINRRRGHQEIINLTNPTLAISADGRSRTEGVALIEPLRRSGMQTVSVYGRSDFSTHKDIALRSEQAALLITAIVEQLEDGE